MNCGSEISVCNFLYCKRRVSL